MEWNRGCSVTCVFHHSFCFFVAPLHVLAESRSCSFRVDCSCDTTHSGEPLTVRLSFRGMPHDEVCRGSQRIRCCPIHQDGYARDITVDVFGDALCVFRCAAR